MLILRKEKEYFLRSGQSLLEVVMSLGIGVALVLGVVALIFVNTRTSSDSRVVQKVASVNQELSSDARQFAETNWMGVFDLAKGASNRYFLVSSSTGSMALSGKESIFVNDITTGLVGHWKFDESGGSTAYDTSGNWQNGTLIAGPARISAAGCKASMCLQMTSASSQYVSVADSNYLDITNTFSFSFWLRATSTGARQTIISKNNTGTDTAGAYNVYLNSNGSVQYETTGGTSVTSAASALGFGSLTHVVVSFDNSASSPKMLIYVNGVSVAQGDPTVPSALGTTLLIGRGGVTANYFNGVLDDVRIYNRALSSAEVNALYRSQAFSRSFYTQEVRRENCGLGNITENATTSCTFGQAGSEYIENDPFTRKIVTVSEWGSNSSAEQVSYITRQGSGTFYQTRWESGSGQEDFPENPAGSVVNGSFSTGTSVNGTSSPGILQLF